MRPQMSLQVACLRKFLQAFEKGAGKCTMLPTGPLCLVKTCTSRIVSDGFTYSKIMLGVNLMRELSPTFNPAKLDYVLMPPIKKVMLGYN